METLAMIIMILGIIALPVAIIMLIISLVKKKAKKVPLIVLAAGIVLFIVGGLMMPTEPVEEPAAVVQVNPAAQAIKNGVLQYPSSNDNFKYNVYDTYVEITEYIGSQSASSITVPAKLENLPVYVVAAQVFDNCKVPTIVFEEGIYDISSDFSGSLVNVTLPSTLDYVGGMTFKNCYSLKSVVIPEGIDSIQVSAFESCSSLTEITIPSTVTSLDTAVFAYCSKLSKVNLPEGLKSIGERAFVSCDNLKSIKIPETVEKIGSYAFHGTGLVSVEIPASVKTIGSSAFLACESLKEVKVYNSDVTIEPNNTLFSQCNSDLIVYGKPASAIAKVCAADKVYFKTLG